MIVVDASLALKFVLDEDDSAAARSLWRDWQRRGESLCAPTLFRAETASVLRREVFRHRLTEAEGLEAYQGISNAAVEIREPDDLYRVAWSYAEQFNRPAVYDSCYLALAAIIGCELWTADRRLRNAVDALHWVRLL